MLSNLMADHNHPPHSTFYRSSQKKYPSEISNFGPCWKIIDRSDHHGPFWIVSNIFLGLFLMVAEYFGPKEDQKRSIMVLMVQNLKFQGGMLCKDASDGDRPASLTLYNPATTISLITSIIHLHNFSLNFVSDGTHPCWAGILAGGCHCGLFKLCPGELSCRR